MSAQDQGVRELCIAIRQLVFKPAPVGFGTAPQQFREFGREDLAGLIDKAVTTQPAKVLMDADRPNVQARGDLKFVKAGSARAKSWPAIICTPRDPERHRSEETVGNPCDCSNGTGTLLDAEVAALIDC